MKKYILMVKVLGGEWKRHRAMEVDYQTNDLAEAIGMKETIADLIREVMVIEIDVSFDSAHDCNIVTKSYSLIE